MEPLELWGTQAGPSRFIKKIIAGVAERRRVLCLSTPVPRPLGMANAIKERLRSELSLDCAVLDLSSRKQSGSIVHLLAEYLSVSVIDIGSVADFARHPLLADKVIIVGGIDKRQIRRWSLFLRQLQVEGAADFVIGPIV